MASFFLLLVAPSRGLCWRQTEPRITGRKDEGHVRGPLHDYFEALSVPDSLRRELAAQIDAFVMARVKAELIGRAAHAPIKPPLPELTPMQIQAVIRCGKERPWSKRPTHRMDSFKWVAENYGTWIPGLLQSHLWVADRPLFNAFATRMKREGGLPDWLDVPSKADAILRKVTDPQQRKELLAGRELRRIGGRMSLAVLRT